MARTMIDIDDELLAEAARLLGTRTRRPSTPRFVR
jgi:Arc/MetJ family transcription regulator